MYFDKFRPLSWITAGLRLWSNKIPLRFDSYSSACSNNCSYCFSKQMAYGNLARQHKIYDPKMIKIGNIVHILNACKLIFEEQKYNPKSYQQYWLLHRGLIENGTMSDPFLKEEVEMRNTINFMQIASNYGLPVYFNTKGNALIESEEHFDMLCNLNKSSGSLVDISISGNNNKLLKKFEPKAPPSTKRIELMKRLTDNGVDVIASARPIIKGVTDFDYENYIGELCDTGINSIHLRTLIISGRQLKVPFWKNYCKENKMIFKNISYRYPMDYFVDLFERAQKIAKPKGVGVTASHTLFFRFGTSNKCDYSKTSNKIQNSLFRPGIDDVLHDTYKHKKNPKVLYYDEVLKPQMKKNQEFMDHRFLMTDKTSTLIWSSSCVRKNKQRFIMKGEDIVKNSIWQGWNAGIDRHLMNGYLASINGIYIVFDNKGKQQLDDNKNIIYVYIPDEYKKQNINSTHSRKADVITTKELKEIGISL